MGISYSEKVQSSSLGVSYAEQETIKQIDKLMEEWKDTRKQILKLHARIRKAKMKKCRDGIYDWTFGYSI